VSDWSRKGSANRRDVRNAKDVVRQQSGSSRDTKRWCRGKAGVEHKPKCVDYRATKLSRAGYPESFLKGWKLLICTECGKELKTYFPFGKGNPPSWVTESRGGDR
jgi:hypothetical protein